MDIFSTQNIILFAIIFFCMFIIWFFNRNNIKKSINKAGVDSKAVLENENILATFKGLFVIRYFIPIPFILYWNSTVSVSDKRITYSLSPITFFVRISIYFKQEEYSIYLKNIVKSKSGKSIKLYTNTETVQFFSFNKKKIEDIFNLIQQQITK